MWWLQVGQSAGAQCVSICPSIYLSWWCFGESSLAGSRVGNVLQMLPVRREETIPRRFQSSPPNPPHLNSLNPSISSLSEVLMSPGEVEAEAEREQTSANEVIKSCCVCVSVWTIHLTTGGMLCWNQGVDAELMCVPGLVVMRLDRHLPKQV